MSQPEETAAPLESLLPMIEQEIAESSSPETSQPRTLSEQIKDDPELMEILERRPQLCAEFMRRAEAIDVLARQVKAYLTGSSEGFEQMHDALLMLEVPNDPATGKPILAPDGCYSFPRRDEWQRTVLDRFMSYLRIWYVWPQLVQRINTAENLTDEERRLRISAVSLVRAMLCEYGPIAAGTC